MTAKRKTKDAPKLTWGERLDAAVMRQFPGVTCETEWSIFAMRHVTSWREAGTEDKKLKPAQARLVRAFVQGYMAAEEYAHDR